MCSDWNDLPDRRCADGGSDSLTGNGAATLFGSGRFPSRSVPYLLRTAPGTWRVGAKYYGVQAASGVA